MKIGIITFQRAHNYGAILQCYALQEILTRLGHDVEIIDYEHHYYDYYKPFLWKRVAPWHPRSAIINLFSLKRRRDRYRSFNNFIENSLKLSDSEALSKMEEEYDTIIIGSDQVWNPNNSRGNYDKYYWGQFKTDRKPRIISYGASMGGSWKTSDWDIISQLLNNFDAISVREDYLRDVIKEKTDRNAKWVLDPTLLQTHEFWISKAKKVNMPRPYLFFYQARRDKRALEYAKNAAKEMNLDFVCISADIMAYNSKAAIAVGPAEFLGLMRNADYVLTTSFHGTVFCYQFKKQFSTLRLGDGDDGRAESIMQLLHLDNHLISLGDKPVETTPGWNEVDERLQEIRKDSLSWLEENLK